MSINAWISAFTIYIDIYAQAHTEELSSLLAYNNIVRDLERGYGQAAFNFYDRSFRAHRQTQPLPWGILHSELWIRATSLHIRSQGDSSLGSTSKRYCYDFNKTKGCTKQFCQYAHICSFCRKNHPGYKCFSKPSSQTYSNNKTASPRTLTNSVDVSNSNQKHSFRNNTNKK